MDSGRCTRALYGESERRRNSKKGVEAGQYDMSDERKPPRTSRPSTRTLIVLMTVGSLAFVMLVYAITSSVGPEFSTDVSSATRPAVP